MLRFFWPIHIGLYLVLRFILENGRHKDITFPVSVLMFGMGVFALQALSITPSHLRISGDWNIIIILLPSFLGMRAFYSRVKARPTYNLWPRVNPLIFGSVVVAVIFILGYLGIDYSYIGFMLAWTINVFILTL
jgi:hypothetical protein